MQHPSQSYLNQNHGGQGQNGQGNNGLPWGGPFPSLHLWPLQDTFVMKMIHLPEGQRIKIGRQTNTKTVPGERNAYFDSKVLSRLHAEIWEQGGKIFIKDVRSSNGTFINGERLSPESVESEPFELKNEDQVEFGIDIVSEDNRTIVHHKVAAKVYCVFGPEDAALSARELVNYQNQDTRGVRRAPQQQNGHPNNQLSQMGPSVMSAGGKSSGLTFDHVLTKLQNELRASKETGAELQNLATTFTDIQDTLGGGLAPSQNGSATQYIPPQYRSASAEAQAALAGPHGQQAAAFIALQNQLTETQASLGSQLEKIRLLEGQLKEQESIQSEISTMKEQIEESKREVSLLLASGGSILGGSHRGRQLTRRNEDEDDDDDDARSVMTMMDNEESEQRVRDRRRAECDGPDPRRDRDGRSSNIDRPRTPEPTNLNGDVDSDEDQPSSSHPNGTSMSTTTTSRESEIIEQNTELVGKIATLSAEIQEAVTLSQTLQSQHSEAMSAVRLLTERVGVLENGIASKVAEEVEKAEQKWESWKVKFEEGWKRERESWDSERERLRGVVRGWEEASRRAHEEEEERELNESLSEDESDAEEGNGNDDEANEVLSLDGWQDGDGSNSANPGKLGSLNGGNAGSKKSRRRRPSQKAILAVQAIKNLSDPNSSSPMTLTNENNGSSTPKSSSTSILLPINGSSSSSNGLNNGGGRVRIKSRKRGQSKRAHNLARSGLSRTIQLDEKEKENSNSSESGRESVSTLKDGDETDVVKSKSSNGKTKNTEQEGQVKRPVPVFTVLVVLVAAGVYWHKFHKD